MPVRLGRRRRRKSQRIALPRADRPGLARLPARRRSPASSTATASTGRTSRPKGHRFNPNKVVLDPYAKAIGRDLTWDDSLFGYTIGDPTADLSFDERDSAAVRPAGGGRRHGLHLGRRPPAAHALAQDAHLRAARQGLHASCIPDVPEKLRGTYAGLASEAAIQHLHDLGVTAVELLPVHHHVDDRHLVEQGLAQLLGLQHARLLRPRPRYAADSDRRRRRCSEFKMMVRALHAAGIEVILDVVYNHTAEGNQLGPTLSLRGIDNAAYYRLSPEDPRYYMDFTGCGNTLNMHAPARPPAHHGQPALLGHGDARRRLPLRPGQHAGPRAVRGRTSWARSSTSSTRTRSCRRSS